MVRNKEKHYSCKGICHINPHLHTVRRNNPKPLFKAQCADCQNKFDVSEDGSTESKLEKKWFLIGSSGELFHFTYYDCPFCGRRSLLTVDDESSYEIAKTVEKETARSLKGVQEKLALARETAYEKIKGSNYFDPDSGLNYNVEF